MIDTGERVFSHQTELVASCTPSIRGSVSDSFTRHMEENTQTITDIKKGESIYFAAYSLHSVAANLESSPKHAEN